MHPFSNPFLQGVEKGCIENKWLNDTSMFMIDNYDLTFLLIEHY